MTLAESPQSSGKTDEPKFMVIKSATDAFIQAEFGNIPEDKREALRRIIARIESDYQNRVDDSPASRNMNNTALTAGFNELNAQLQVITGKKFSAPELTRLADTFRTALQNKYRK